MKEPLLPKPPDIKVVAHDLFEKRYIKSLRDFRFRVGVYGILRKGKQILIQRHPLISKFGLPGGGVSIGEKIADALKREFKEETGLKIKITNLFGVSEDMFVWEKQSVQGIGLYYEVERVGGRMLKEGNQEDTKEVKFMDLDKLNRGNMQRYCWKIIRELKKLKIK